eukprot:1874198-Rhodomonas_salina.2
MPTRVPAMAAKLTTLEVELGNNMRALSSAESSDQHHQPCARTLKPARMHPHPHHAPHVQNGVSAGCSDSLCDRAPEQAVSVHVRWRVRCALLRVRCRSMHVGQHGVLVSGSRWAGREGWQSRGSGRCVDRLRPCSLQPQGRSLSALAGQGLSQGRSLSVAQQLETRAQPPRASLSLREREWGRARVCDDDSEG